MFALLYGLGLRVGEVSRLCGGDVDLNRQLLVIRDTKFSKSRLFRLDRASANCWKIISRGGPYVAGRAVPRRCCFRSMAARLSA
jgi:integrase